MKWVAKITGDRTISLIAPDGFKALSVDMLAHDTMKAGTNGARLIRTLNDLAMLASCANGESASEKPQYSTEDGFSPNPWMMDWNSDKQILTLRDGHGKPMSRRVFPKGMSKEKVLSYLTAVESAVLSVNGMKSGAHEKSL